ncbi:EKC/KEOPS complex subunit LAGE3 [Manis pentadactyla]|uniref:EKC/KEOPS complex subunit LAGE3 n=1 Tax=Manis pentadactyla TaxID=143292 RepID=UPI00255D0489|nr:EKC/KEOPS complex subunit LAGE3 [Manis pentadactyla]
MRGAGPERGAEFRGGAAVPQPPAESEDRGAGAAGAGPEAECGAMRAAEIARTSLASDAEPHRVVLHKELTVRGSILRARWRAADPRLLRVSVVNFLDQLSLVLRTLQRFGPPMLH